MHKLIPLLGVAALLAAGCGSSNKSTDKSLATPAPTSTSSTSTSAAPASSGGAGKTLSLSADPGGALKFDKSALSAKAGRVTLVMKNPSSLPHAIAVEGKGVDKDGQTVGNGGTSTVTVTLKPGRYEFYCPVDGHKQAGMEGHLTVS
jgi:uncharacterized cupredoxin-like copper-binding protein